MTGSFSIREARKTGWHRLLLKQKATETMGESGRCSLTIMSGLFKRAITNNWLESGCQIRWGKRKHLRITLPLSKGTGSKHLWTSVGYLVPVSGMEFYLENTHKDSGRWKVHNILVPACVVVRSLVPRGGGALLLRGLSLKFYISSYSTPARELHRWLQHYHLC